MAYQTCPKDDRCGSYLRILNSMTEMSAIIPQGSLCTYKLVFPELSSAGDKLAVGVGSLSNVRGLMIAAFSYASNSYRFLELEAQKTFTLSYPYSAFLTLEGLAAESSFYLKARIIKEGDPILTAAAPDK